MIKRYIMRSVFNVYLGGSCLLAISYFIFGNTIINETKYEQFQASIFSFDAMQVSKHSFEHPFTYAQHLIKLQLRLELLNGTNLIDFKAQSKLPPDRREESLKNKENDVNKSPEKNEIPSLASFIDPAKARHVLIAATWRSGSTFLGDLLSRYPGVFYSFEPLHYYDPDFGAFKDNRMINFAKKLEPDHIKFISDVFKCKPEPGYFIHAMEPKNHNLFFYNFRLWNVCKNLLSERFACFIPDLYFQTCPMFPIRVIKTVRMRVAETERLLLDGEIKQTLKIVVLVRDPRGVMNSRLSLGWCKKQHSCINSYTVCNNLNDDILAALRLKEKYPGRIHLIRYEDMSVDPFTTTDKLLEFLDLAPNKLIESFLEEHTQTVRNNTLSSSHTIKEAPKDNSWKYKYSTSRNSKETAFNWKTTMKSEDIEKVQTVCKEPMQMLGYNLMHNISDNRYWDDFPLIVRSTKQIWP